MKYRCKINYPGGMKGEIFSKDFRFSKYGVTTLYYPEDFPEIFEPIPEETPVERVARWLYETPGLVLKGTWLEISKKLLNAGLDPEKLK